MSRKVTTQYDELSTLTAEYQRALKGRDKWQAKVDAAQGAIDALVTPATTPATTSAPAPAPATQAPVAEFTDPAPAPVAQ